VPLNAETSFEGHCLGQRRRRQLRWSCMAMNSMSPSPFVETEPLLAYSFELATEHLTRTIRWLVENVSKQQGELEVQREKLARIEQGSGFVARPIQPESSVLGSPPEDETKVPANHGNKSALASLANLAGGDRSGIGGGNDVANTMDTPGNGPHHGAHEAMAPDIQAVVNSGGSNAVAAADGIGNACGSSGASSIGGANDAGDARGVGVDADVQVIVDCDEMAKPSESILQGRVVEKSGTWMEKDVRGNKSSTSVDYQRHALEGNKVDEADGKQCEEKTLEVLQGDRLHRPETRRLQENLEQLKCEVIARLDKLEQESAELMRMTKNADRAGSRTIHAPPSGAAGDIPCIRDGSASGDVVAAPSSIGDTVAFEAALSKELTSRGDPVGATVSTNRDNTINDVVDTDHEMVHHAPGSTDSSGTCGAEGASTVHGLKDAGAVVVVAEHAAPSAAALAAQQAAQQAMESAEAAKAANSYATGQQSRPEFEDFVAAGSAPGRSSNDARSAGHGSSLAGAAGNMLSATGHASAGAAAGTAHGTFQEEGSSASDEGKVSASARDVEAEVKTQLEALRLEVQLSMHNLRRDMEQRMSEVSHPASDPTRFDHNLPPPAQQFTPEVVGFGTRSSHMDRAVKPLSNDDVNAKVVHERYAERIPGSLIKESSSQHLSTGNSDQPTGPPQEHLGKLNSETGEQWLANISQGRNRGATLAVDPAASLFCEDGGTGAAVVNDGLGDLHLRVASLEAVLHGLMPRRRVAGDPTGQTDDDRARIGDVTGRYPAGSCLITGSAEIAAAEAFAAAHALGCAEGDVPLLPAPTGVAQIPGHSQTEAVDARKAAIPPPERSTADHKDDRDHQSQAQVGKSSLLQDLKASRQEAENVTRIAIASGNALPLRPTAGWEDPRIQAEFEHFRKLFEFIESVLPRDAAEAMKFFSHEGRSRNGVGSGMTSDGSCGQSAAHTQEMQGSNLGTLRRHLQEQVDQHVADTRHDRDNLTNAIKGLQRGLEQNQGKIGDLMKQVAGMWRERDIAQSSQGLPQHNETAGIMGQERTVDAARATVAASDANASICRERGESALKEDFNQKLDQPVEDVGSSSSTPHVAAWDFVSQQVLDGALEGLREDVRSWLDALRDSMIAALQQKADSQNLKDDVLRISQATETAGENFALFAKRTLVGKCASCDAPFAVDPSLVRRTPPISLQRSWPTRNMNGAQISIRHLMEHGSSRLPSLPAVQPARRDSGSRLPKLQDAKAARDPGQGRIIRNISSQPDLRSWRQDHPRPDDL